MAIREEVLRVLRGTEATRIRFSFQSIYGTPVSVDQTTFLRVAAAIEDGSIGVTSEGIDPGHGGVYEGDQLNGGILRSRPVNDRRYQKSAIIHESVHASFDLTRTTLADVDNEVAAYLANTLYLRFTFYPTARLFDRETPSRRVYESLWRATGSILQNGSASETQIEQIRRRLSVHPTYQHLLSDGCFEAEGDCLYAVRVYNG